MKPAREPASSRQKPCTSLKTPYETCPFAAPCGPRRKKKTVVRHQLFHQKPPGSCLSFSRTGVQPSSDSPMIELPSALAKSGAHHPIEPYHTLRDSVSCLSHTATPPEGHQIGVRKRRAPGNTTLSQPYRRRVSIERMHREGSQLAASLESKPGPTPAGKTLPYSYPENSFRRERARLHTTELLERPRLQ